MLVMLCASYLVGSTNYQEQFKDAAHHAIDCSVSALKLVSEYCKHLWQNFVVQTQNFFSQQKNDTVEIQKINMHNDKNPSDDHEDFYLDYDKCTDNTEACRFNEQFFSDTYYAIGPKNIDAALHIDYPKD